MRAAALTVAAAVLLVSCGDRVEIGASVADSSVAPSEPSVMATPPTARWDWLASFGAEVSEPTVPDGWKVLDFDDLRFAVPLDWVVPQPSWCSMDAPGAVLLPPIPGQTPPCGPAKPLPDSYVTIERIDGDHRSAGGPDADRVLATFTEAGVDRVLQTGHEADTTGWQSVEFDGIALLAPAQWPVVDLPSTVVETTRPDGASEMSWTPDPDSCGAAMFGNGVSATVYLGTSPPPSCPAGLYFVLVPADGLWVRSVPTVEADSLGTPVAHGTVDGLDVTVVRIADGELNRAPSSVLDLIVRSESTTTWVSIGVGVDVSIARSVLRSLHAN